MRVLFVNPVGVIGGAERVLLTTITALLNTQPNIQLHLITASDGPLSTQAEKLGVQVKVLKLPEKLNQLGDSGISGGNRAIQMVGLLWKFLEAIPQMVKYLREFERSLREINPDIIHSHGIKTHLLIACTRIQKIPIIWHIHDFYSSRPLVAQLFKWISHRANLGIAISQAVAQDAQATMPNLPIKTVYNSVDINYFCPKPEAIPDPTTFTVGLVATFARWKGHNIFLEAAAYIVKTRPDLKVQFSIVGGAIYQTQGSQFSPEELRDKAISLEIGDRVEFCGFQSDIVKIYRQLDIVVHASTQPEPFGLAIVEAMACGRPVIVSQAGGAVELFTHNYDAVGIPPREPIALAIAILDLLDHPEKRQTLGKNARLTAIERFSHEHLGQQVMDI